MTNSRPLGHSGLVTPPLVLGGNVFGVGDMDQPASFAVLDAFVAGGGTMIDTADVYAIWRGDRTGGDSERTIGAWLKARGRRDDVLIATKGGLDMGGGRKGLSRGHIERAIDASLARLGTDYVDLYYAHRDDPLVPLEEVTAVFDALVKAGKVRAIGGSNYSADRLAGVLDVAAAAGRTPFTVLQPLYSLMEREAYEGPVQALAAERGLGVLTYFSLANGFLTGKYRTPADIGDGPRAGGVKPYLNDRGLRVLAALDAVGAETGATPAQVALAWLAAKPGVTAPIASATSVLQVEELLGAMRLALTDEQVAKLDAASS